MLTRVNINESTFLHQQSSLDIKKQINHCQSCDAVEECASDLEDGLDVLDITYCPNQSALDQTDR